MIPMNPNEPTKPEDYNDEEWNVVPNIPKVEPKLKVDPSKVIIGRG